VRILVVEDHHLFAKALCMHIAAVCDRCQIYRATTFDQAKGAVGESQRFDLILLDLNIPGAKGIEALLALIACEPRPKIAVVSGSEDPYVMRQVFLSGAIGFLPKADHRFDFGLQTILEGRSYFPAEASNPDLDRLLRKKGLASELSQRELQVLEWLCQGKQNKEIARALSLSEATVKLHVAAIASKMSTRTRTETVAQAFLSGLARPVPMAA
jgi:DNA-binding NarL/FixJ family response regulator